MGKGRAPCCAKVGLNKGSWTPEEDMRLIAYIQKYGHANWRALPKQAGLLRCGKSCRLRWINYLRPDLKRGNFTAEEEETIIKLHGMLGNKWSKIAACLPGRTDNEIKNVWNTHLKKRVAPSGHEHGARENKNNKKESAAGAEAAATVPSPSPSSSTTTTGNYCSSGDSGGEQQSNASEEDQLDLKHLDILPVLDDAAFDFDMLLVEDDPVPPEPYYCPPSASVPTSPCASSSTSPPPAPAPPRGPVADDLLLDLPTGIELDPELWSIIDGDGPFTEAPPAPRHGNATEANAAAAATSHGEEEGKEWWLENLERELGLWGPVEDYQCPTSPLGLAHPDPLPAMAQDPVTCYFQAGPNATSSFQGPELTTSNQMEL